MSANKISSSRPPRRRLLQTLAAAALAGVFAAPLAAGAAYPDKPLRLIVPFAPGGVADVVARSLQNKLSEALGQPVVVENRGGAGSVVGTAAAVRAAPDGYTALLTTTAVAVNPSLNPNAGYDVVKDLVPVINIASSPNILVATPGLGATTLPQALEKARAGGLNFSSPGVGTTPYLSSEYLFKSLAKVSVTHVPYKGGGPALAAGIAGEVQLVAIPLPPAAPHVKAGKLVPLAVTSRERLKAWPNVPTVAESGFPGFEDSTWVGVFFPAGTPAEAVNKLNGEIARLLAQPEVRQQLVDLGFEPVGGSQASFASYVAEEAVKWAKVVKETGATAAE